MFEDFWRRWGFNYDPVYDPPQQKPIKQAISKEQEKQMKIAKFNLNRVKFINLQNEIKMILKEELSNLNNVNDVFKMLGKSYPTVIKEFHNVVGELYKLDGKQAGLLMDQLEKELLQVESKSLNAQPVENTKTNSNSNQPQDLDKGNL